MREALQVLHLGRLPKALLLSVPIAYVMFDFAENAAVLRLKFGAAAPSGPSYSEPG